MSDEIVLGWRPHNTFDDKTALVQVMARWHQATSHYPSHYPWWAHDSSLSNRKASLRKPLATDKSTHMRIGHNELTVDQYYYWQYHKSPLVYGMVLKKYQAIDWTNADLLPTGSLQLNFNEIWWKIQTFHSKQIFENVISKMGDILFAQSCVEKQHGKILSSAMSMLTCLIQDFTFRQHGIY